jgi:hypothetical protein
MFELLIAAICGVGAARFLGPVLKHGLRTIWKKAPLVLPPPGPPPEDRAEAVRRVLKHLQRKTIAELEDVAQNQSVRTWRVP